MNGRILIVEDEKSLLDLLEMSLTAEGYNVRTAQNASEAVAAIDTDTFDLILLDLILPDRPGVELAGKIKNTPQTAHIPIIMLTAKDKETDIVVGLNIGADDYVTKPFSMQVLIARIQTVLRRVRTANDTHSVLSAGPIKVIPDARRVLVENRPVKLTDGEFNILTALIKAGGKVLSRDQLMTVLGQKQNHKNDRIVDVHIAAMRKKLGKGKNIIKTIHRHGYRIQS